MTASLILAAFVATQGRGRYVRIPSPSCPRRKASFVLTLLVRLSIDDGGVSGIACRSLGLSRSTREEALMCAAPSAPEAVGARAWEVMLRAWGPRGWPPPPGTWMIWTLVILIGVALRQTFGDAFDEETIGT